MPKHRERHTRGWLASRIQVIQRRAEVLAVTGPKAEAVLAQLLADGYGGGQQGDGELTAVESAANARERHEPQWAAIVDEVTSALRALTKAQAMIDQVVITASSADRFTIDPATGRRVDRFRCTGGGSEKGAGEWGRAECENLAEEGRTSGLCSACRKRKERWERDQQAVSTHVDPRAHRGVS